MAKETTQVLDTLKARLHKTLDIKLNSVSGFDWQQPEFNSSALRLVARRHLRSKSNNFGASGHDLFQFEPLQPGIHKIHFKLGRPFGNKQPVETKTFSLDIS
jgi:predicted secreted protein